MATNDNAPAHDLGSLRIHEGQRKGGRVGKVLAIFFGVLIILASAAAGVTLAGIEAGRGVAVAKKAVGPGVARLCSMPPDTSRHDAAQRSQLKSQAASPEFSLTKARTSVRASCSPLWTMQTQRELCNRLRRSATLPRPPSQTMKCN